MLFHHFFYVGLRGIIIKQFHGLRFKLTPLLFLFFVLQEAADTFQNYVDVVDTRLRVQEADQRVLLLVYSCLKTLVFHDAVIVFFETLFAFAKKAACVLFERE